MISDVWFLICVVMSDIRRLMFDVMSDIRRLISNVVCYQTSDFWCQTFVIRRLFLMFCLVSYVWLLMLSVIRRLMFHIRCLISYVRLLFSDFKHLLSDVWWLILQCIWPAGSNFWQAPNLQTNFKRVMHQHNKSIFYW